jgi:hypothetical protein
MSPSHVFLLLKLVFSLGIPKPYTVIYAYTLPWQEVLSPELCFFILTTLVQAPSSGHAPTTIRFIQCTTMVISISASTTPTTLGSNGWRSGDLMGLSGGGGN